MSKKSRVIKFKVLLGISVSALLIFILLMALRPKIEISKQYTDGSERTYKLPYCQGHYYLGEEGYYAFLRFSSTHMPIVGHIIEHYGEYVTVYVHGRYESSSQGLMPTDNDAYMFSVRRGPTLVDMNVLNLNISEVSDAHINLAGSFTSKNVWPHRRNYSRVDVKLNSISINKTSAMTDLCIYSPLTEEMFKRGNLGIPQWLSDVGEMCEELEK